MKKRFAKLEDGGLVFAPKKVLWHNKWVFNPSEAKLRELGYKEVVYGEYNIVEIPEGKHVEESYIEDSTTITIEYILVDNITE
jgi:hypothetical protein